MTEHSTHYHLSKNGVTNGPYTISQLKTMWQNGLITADCLCWAEGFDEWIDVSDILELESLAFESPKSEPQDVPSEYSDSPRAIPQSQMASSCTTAQLLKIVTQRDYMVQSYVVTAMLALLVNFVVVNQKDLSAAFQISVFVIATASSVLSCYFVFSLMRSMNTGKLGAWLCVIAIFLFPLLVGVVIVLSINSMAKKELASAGIKDGSNSSMKNQIKRMQQ